MDYRPSGLSIWDPWFVEHQGSVHLFNQQGLAPESTRDPQIGNWIGHAVSTDLLHWEEQPAAIGPDPARPLEDLWPWTGCAVMLGETCYNFYTMRSSAEKGWRERIGVATSRDFRHWERYANNPVIEPDPRWYSAGEEYLRDYARIDCRDLSVVYDAGRKLWWGFFATRVAAEEQAETSVIAVASSTDLLHWTQLPPAFAPGIHGTVEVPDVFPLDGRWYMTCLTSSVHGNRGGFTDPYVLSGTMYAVADHPAGPYREIAGDNLLISGHSCRSLVLDGERYILSTRDGALSPPFLARSLPDGRLRLAYCPRTAAWREVTLIAPDAPPPIARLPLSIYEWDRHPAGRWSCEENGYRGHSRTGWQIADFGIGAALVEVEADLTLEAGVAAGIVFRPDTASLRTNDNLAVLLDAQEQTVIVARLPRFEEAHRRRWTVQHGRTYHLRVVFRLPRIEVYVDDLLALQCAIWPANPTAPSVGVMVDRATAQVCRVTTYALGENTYRN